MVSRLLLIAIAALLATWLWCWWRLARRVLQGRPLLSLRPRRPVPWSIVDVSFFMALFLLLQVLAGTLVRGILGIESVEVFDEIPLRTRAVLMVAGSVATLLTAGLSMLAVRVSNGATASDLGWDRRAIARDAGLGAAVFFLIAPLIYGIQQLLVQWFPYKHPLVNMLTEQPDPAFIAVSGFTALLVAPLAEEYFFRVLLQGYLERFPAWWRAGAWRANCRPLGDAAANRPGAPGGSLGQADGRSAGAAVPQALVDSSGSDGPRTQPAASAPDADATPAAWPILVSALLFATLHASHGPAPVPLFLLAIGLGYVYRQTHRILPCIVAHLLLNASSLLVLLITLAQSP